jgi:hypothetical protein
VIRAIVDGLRTAHSLMRTTIHPFHRSLWETRRSRLLLVSILLRQN